MPLLLTLFYSQVDMKAPDMLQRVAARNQLAEIQDKLKDWPSLIPSCLVVARNRDPMISCYNCKLMVWIDERKSATLTWTN